MEVTHIAGWFRAKESKTHSRCKENCVIFHGLFIAIRLIASVKRLLKYQHHVSVIHSQYWGKSKAADRGEI